jgi:hypothetical protein
MTPRTRAGVTRAVASLGMVAALGSLFRASRWHYVDVGWVVVVAFAIIAGAQLVPMGGVLFLPILKRPLSRGVTFAWWAWASISAALVAIGLLVTAFGRQ